MLKKLTVLGAIFINSSFLYSNEILTGDTKLSCEAILCLSSNTRPKECNPSLNRYFSISHKKWSDTLKARGNFLKLCPIGDEGEKDREFTNLRDNIIKNLKNGCDLDKLNVAIKSRKNLNNDEYSFNYQIFYQISPTLNQSCKALASSVYTNINPIYTCDPKKWYLEEDWKNGYEKVAEKSISYPEYKKLTSTEQSEYARVSFKEYVKYKNIPINKNCWIWSK